MGTRAPFRDLVANKIRDALKNAVSDQDGPKKGNNVLVVDDEALRIINACMPTNDLIAQGFMSESTEAVRRDPRRPSLRSPFLRWFLLVAPQPCRR